MDDFGRSNTFVGISATPNIATRLFDLLCDLWSWAVSWTYAGGEGSWSAQPYPHDPDAPSSGDLYFH